jgi:hypothetical protein
VGPDHAVAEDRRVLGLERRGQGVGAVHRRTSRWVARAAAIEPSSTARRLGALRQASTAASRALVSAWTSAARTALRSPAGPAVGVPRPWAWPARGPGRGLDVRAVGVAGARDRSRQRRYLGQRGVVAVGQGDGVPVEALERVGRGGRGRRRVTKQAAAGRQGDSGGAGYTQQTTQDGTAGDRRAAGHRHILPGGCPARRSPESGSRPACRRNLRPQGWLRRVTL